MNYLLVPAVDGKRWLQDKLNKQVPKPTLQRWRKAANVNLVIDDKGQFSYWMEDLHVIWFMIEALRDMPPKKRTLKNAHKLALIRLKEEQIKWR